MDEELKDMIENAKEIERIKVTVEKLEEDLDRNFEQHREFYKLKTYIAILDAIPAKIEALEEFRDEMKGRYKMLSIIGGIIAFIISSLIAINWG